MKRGPKPSSAIVTDELCSLGCGQQAQYQNASGKLICGPSSNKCPQSKLKNSEKVRQLHKEGRLPGINDAQRLNGARKSIETRRVRVEEAILSGVWDNIPAYRRRDRILLEQGGRCAICGMDQLWNGKPLVFQLDHTNGKQAGDGRENLRMICPNCHSQTDTYCGRNVGWRLRGRG